MKAIVSITLLCCLAVLSCKKSDNSGNNNNTYKMECATDYRALRVSLVTGLILPSGFSPNSDGKNDLLRIVTNDSTAIKSMQLNIMDSTGQKIYTIARYNQSWDGTNASTGSPYPAGVYRVDYTIALSGKGTVADSTFSGHTCIWLFRSSPLDPHCIKIYDPSILNTMTFEDQIDPGTLYTPYSTAENFCP